VLVAGGVGEGAAVGAEEFSEFGDGGAFADVGGGEVLDLGSQVILVEREQLHEVARVGGDGAHDGHPTAPRGRISEKPQKTRR